MESSKHPFDITLRKSGTGTLAALETEPVQAGRLYCIQHVVYRNVDAATDTFVYLYKGGFGGAFYIDYADISAVPYMATFTDNIYLTEGQYLIIDPGASGTNVEEYAYISGWWQDRRDVTP